jgi:hypothetical protein
LIALRGTVVFEDRHGGRFRVQATSVDGKDEISGSMRVKKQFGPTLAEIVGITTGTGNRVLVPKALPPNQSVETAQPCPDLENDH